MSYRVISDGIEQTVSDTLLEAERQAKDLVMYFKRFEVAEWSVQVLNEHGQVLWFSEQARKHRA